MATSGAITGAPASQHRKRARPTITSRSSVPTAAAELKHATISRTSMAIITMITGAAPERRRRHAAPALGLELVAPTTAAASSKQQPQRQVYPRNQLPVLCDLVFHVASDLLCPTRSLRPSESCHSHIHARTNPGFCNFPANRRLRIHTLFPFHVETTTVPAVYHQLASGSCAVPITSLSECSAAAAFLGLSDTTASNDGHRLRLRRQDVFIAPLGRISDCDANIQTEYFCASRATPEACRTDISIGMQCSDDCCGIGVNYHPPYCCEIDLPRALTHPPRPRGPHVGKGGACASHAHAHLETRVVRMCGSRPVQSSLLAPLSALF